MPAHRGKKITIKRIKGGNREKCGTNLEINKLKKVEP